MQKHFSEEEAYMETIGYPKLEEHRTQHQEIIDLLNTISRKSSVKMRQKIASKISNPPSHFREIF